MMMLFVSTLGQTTCSCSCCPQAPCTPTNQGSFSVSSCSFCTYIDCASHFGQCSTLMGADGQNNIATCSSASTRTTTTPASGGGSGGGVTCFHVDTEIMYKNTPLDLASVKRGEHAECTIPHTVSSDGGVRITTTCTSKVLRLTGNHLVYSSIGLVAARHVKAGDELFSDLDQTKTV